MKKFLTLTIALCLISGAAMAEGRINSNALFVIPTASTGGVGNFAVGMAGGPSTTNNDDSCEISVSPAATLLLPFFRVQFNQPSTTAQTTLFTLTNTSRQPQIAHVTIWTDWSFPVIDFNVFLTGYDVQGINLFDIISRGVIISEPTSTGIDISPQGSLSADNQTGNPNFNQAAITNPATGCLTLPGRIPSGLLTDIQNALSVGTYSTCTGRVGGQNGAGNAEGYVTVDVADECSQLLPTDPTFFSADILFDNTLIGDYIHVNPSSTVGNYAGGETMVHIKAIPEGGPNANADLGTPAIPRGTSTNFPFTFYDRYTAPGSVDPAARELDRRQPLPGVWAARYIEDVPTGPTGFATRFAIWREGRVPGNAGCATVSSISPNSVYGFNSNIPVRRIVRFDEQENPSLATGCQISPCPGETTFVTEEASRNLTNAGGGTFPTDFTTTADLGGWMYLNLNGNNCTLTVTSQTFPACLPADRPAGESQSWVVVNMQAEGRYGIDFDAAYLQNGCSPAPLASDPIGPGPNITPFVE